MKSHRFHRRASHVVFILAELGFYFLLFSLPLFRGAVYPVERILFSFGFFGCWVLVEIGSYFRNGCFFHHFDFRRLHSFFPLVLLVSIWLHTLLISSRVEESMIRAWDMTSLFLIFQVTKDLFRDGFRRKRFFQFILIAAFFYTLLGWSHSMGWLAHSWWETPDFNSGPFVNHNHFAGFLCLLIFPILGSILAQRSRYLLHLGVFWLAVFCLLLLTLSRGAWISFFITFFLMGILLYGESSLRTLGKYLILGLVGSLLGFVIFIGSGINPKVTQRAQSMFAVEGKFEFFDFRVKLWASTIEAIKHKPLLGYGLGAFEWEMRPFRKKGFEFAFDYAHNDWLQYAMELGLLLSLIIALYVIKILKDGLRRFYSPDLHEFRFEELGLMAAIVCLLIHSLVDFNLNIFGNTSFFVAFLGLVATVIHGGQAKRDNSKRLA